MSKVSFLSFNYGRSKNSSFKSVPTLVPRDRERQRSSPNLSNQVFQTNVAEMKQVFDKFDTNKDGKISREEYKLAIKDMGEGNAEKEVAKAFQVLDADGDGFIDFKEFMKVNDNGRGVKKSDIHSAFRVFDLDGNGKISAEELLEVLKKLGERCSLESCREMVRGVDKDGDGLIDMDEFVSMMTHTLKLC
ncbi:calmodulin-like protein 30 [Actinidia eriantha]|uniref:calmodulin-like protein 30 n=1 Tax=Actinidia eriantha TaxID=165200 RepID=UPI002587C74C|nr:calmodulin-like protein 30 [Actinidia eriantha]